MNRKDVSVIIESKLLSNDENEIYVQNDDFKGNIQLLKVKDINDEINISNTIESKILVKNNYSLLIMLQDDAYYNTIAIFNDKDELVSIYFRILDMNKDYTSKIHFEDRYLTIELNNDDVLITNQEELLKILQTFKITKEQYNKVCTRSLEVYSDVLKNKNHWIELVNKYFKNINKFCYKSCMGKKN